MAKIKVKIKPVKAGVRMSVSTGRKTVHKTVSLVNAGQMKGAFVDSIRSTFFVGPEHQQWWKDQGSNLKRETYPCTK